MTGGTGGGVESPSPRVVVSVFCVSKPTRTVGHTNSSPWGTMNTTPSPSASKRDRDESNQAFEPEIAAAIAAELRRGAIFSNGTGKALLRRRGNAVEVVPPPGPPPGDPTSELLEQLAGCLL